FADPELGERWWAAQRRAMEHVLTAVAGTPWGDRLMLRGSMVMPLWAGEQARRPRDLDWVVLGEDMDASGAEASRMLDEVVAAIGGTAPADPGLSFDAEAARFDGIWTYERVPGRRVVVPWRGGEGLPPGTVQLDVVFNEPLPLPPVRAAIPVGGGRSVRLPVAGADLSLAWKVQWLYSDMYPQGKDLYDAVLLGERTRVPRAVLADLLRPELGGEAD